MRKEKIILFVMFAMFLSSGVLCSCDEGCDDAMDFSTFSNLYGKWETTSLIIKVFNSNDSIIAEQSSDIDKRDSHYCVLEFGSNGSLTIWTLNGGQLTENELCQYITENGCIVLTDESGDLMKWPFRLNSSFLTLVIEKKDIFGVPTATELVLRRMK